MPDDLRPEQPGLQSPRRFVRELLVVLAVTVVIAALPQWRLRTVNITGAEILPEATVLSLQELGDSSLIVLDLDRIRQQVLVWPRVGSAEVHLDLVGVLHVEVEAASVKASIPAGDGWRGVARDGSPAGFLDEPQSPVLVDFPEKRNELRRGLAVAERLGRSTGRSVQRVRRITPADMEVMIASVERPQALFVRVTAAGSHAEKVWCDRLGAGQEPAPWSDLRRDDRIVIGGVS